MSERGKRVRVFAYGSNLWAARIEARVGRVEIVATGRVRSYDLRFHKRSRDGSAKANAFATGVSDDVVWGVVYELDSSEKRRLDAFEGLGGGYFETQVEVLVGEGVSVDAWMYVANPDFVDDGLAPYDWYHRFCVEGAREHGFPAWYVDRIAGVVSEEDPDRDRRERESAVFSSTKGIGRIVSLLPSATEIVAALGLGDRLVGRSHECDFPVNVTRLPVCTAARLPLDAGSREIDVEVKRLLAQALSIYEIDEAVLGGLAPELIVTQSQCDVCAVSESDVEQAVRDVLGAGVRVVSLCAETLDGIWRDIETVAAAAGVEAAATSLVSTLRGRIAGIERRLSGESRERPGVLCIEWMDPLMSAGNWIPELVERAGGRPLLGHAGSASPWVEWEQVVAADPDVIVLLPCGFDIARTRGELDLLTSRPEWGRLGAVRSGRVFITDGNQYFNRPGPRIVESIEIMAEILHPDLFAFGHRGTGWEPL